MQGKVCIVTGAAGGIGTAVCRQLAEAGAKIALFDVNEAAGSKIAAEVGGEFISCNVADRESMQAALSACVDKLGTPDYAFLNAGVMTVPADQPFMAIEDVSVEQFQRIVGVNLAGVFLGLKLLLPLMREAGGAVTVTASTVGLALLPIDPLYSATKHAVVGLCRSVAAANEGGNVRVNVICPGGVDTGIVPQALREAGMDAMSPDLIAAEVLDLLQQGPNGEVRVKSTASTPAFVVDVPDVNR